MIIKETKENGKPGVKFTGRTIDWEDVHRRLDLIEAGIDGGREPSRETIKALLKKRAEVLAKGRSKKEKSEAHIFVVEFQLGNEKYGIEASYLQEVFPLRELTPLPGTPGFIMGIINIRGKIIAVMNIKRFFGLPDKGITELNRVLIVRKDTMETGILADNVLGVTGINPEKLQPAMDTLTGINADYLQGITPERLIVLNIARILDDPDIIVNKEVYKEKKRGGY